MNKKLHLKRKTLKIAFFFIFFVCLYVSPSVAKADMTEIENSAMIKSLQEKKNHIVTLKFQNVTIKTILLEIQKQTRINFVYKDADLTSFPKKTIDVKNVKLSSVLEQLFESSDLSYRFGETYIMIFKKNQVIEKTATKETIVGKVVDEYKRPVLGATILLLGTTQGAITDNEGNFRLSAKENDSLDVSYIGYKTSKVLVSNLKRNPFIKLEVDVLDVDDVIVDGYQTISKKLNTGSVSTISGDSLLTTGNQTLEQTLQGMIAGLNVTNISGMVGQRQQVRVRGTSSILGNQEPVWVVDGMIQDDPLPFKTQELNSLGAVSSDNMDIIKDFVGSSISWLNPSDIENITVLKDASATVMYGVKAANGVIVITTKKGKAGRMSINYGGKVAVSSKVTYDKLNMMNSKDRIDVSREVIDRGLLGSTDLGNIGYEKLYKDYMYNLISYDEFVRQVGLLETVNVDWFDILFRNPISQDHNIGVSGGSDRFTYRASLGVNQSLGTARGNDKDTYTGSINVSTWLVQSKLKLDARISGSLTNTSAFYTVDPYQYASTTNRSIPLYDEEGEYYFYEGSRNGRMFNMLNELEYTDNQNSTAGINTAFNLTWDILKGLKFISAFGLSHSSMDGQSHADERSYHIAMIRGYDYGAAKPSDYLYKVSQLPHGGELNNTFTKNLNYSWKNQLNYDHLFEGGHRLGFMFANEIRSSQYNGYSNTIYGYLPSRGKTVVQPPLTILNNGEQAQNSLYNQKYKNNIVDRKTNTLSFLGNFNYSYKERYILSASLRTDASNRFGESKKARRLPVWSIGGRWNIAEEAWMKTQKLFNEISFRGSYGWQGNIAENFGPEVIASIPSTSIDQQTGEYLLQLKSLAYPDLRWEKTKTYNFGFDMGFLENRLSASVNYYVKHSVDLITYTELPTEYGIATMPINSGSMTNKGYEITISGTPIRKNDFVWTLGFNTAKNTNKLKSKAAVDYGWRAATGGQLLKEGYAYSSFWAFNYRGLNPLTGVPEYTYPEGLSELEKLDPTNWLQYMGQTTPDFTGGFSTTVRYKTLSFSASFSLGIGGHQFIAPLFQETSGTPNIYYNLSNDMLTRWRKPGDENIPGVMPTIPSKGVENTNLPKGNEQPHILYNYISDRVVSSSYLRCNNMSLNYTIPQKLIKKSGIKSLSVNFGVSNPFMIVSKDFKGKDPEVATGKQPMAQTYSFGINISL